MTGAERRGSALARPSDHRQCRAIRGRRVYRPTLCARRLGRLSYLSFMVCRTAALVGICLLAAITAGCGGESHGPARSATSTPSRTATTAVTPTSTIAAAACSVSDLRITDGLGGSQYVGPNLSASEVGGVMDIILFTNVGPSNCSMYGYPGLAMLNFAGEQTVQAQRTSTGTLGGIWPPGLQGVGDGYSELPQVVLRPGESASAGVETSASSTGSCTEYQDFLITPPGDTQSVRVNDFAPISACPSIDIDPVVPGSQAIYAPPPSPTATASDARADAVLACHSEQDRGDVVPEAAAGFYIKSADAEALTAALIDSKWRSFSNSIEGWGTVPDSLPLSPTEQSIATSTGSVITSVCQSLGVNETASR